MHYYAIIFSYQGHKMTIILFMEIISGIISTNKSSYCDGLHVEINLIVFWS